MQYNLVELMEDTHFGKLVFEKRKAANLTQQQLADLANISKSYVSTIENARPHSVTGAISNPEKPIVLSVVEVLNKVLPENDQIDINQALMMAGHAPIFNKNPLMDETAADFSILTENQKQNLYPIVDYLNREVVRQTQLEAIILILKDILNELEKQEFNKDELVIHLRFILEGTFLADIGVRELKDVTAILSYASRNPPKFRGSSEG